MGDLVPTTDEAEFAQVADLIPEGYMPVACVRVAMMVTPEGETVYSHAWTGQTVSVTLGLLEYAKFKAWEQGADDG